MRMFGILGMAFGVLLVLSGVLQLFDMNPVGWWFDLVFAGALMFLGGLLYSLSRARWFKPAAQAAPLSDSKPTLNKAIIFAASLSWGIALLSFAVVFAGGHTTQASALNGLMFTLVGCLLLVLRNQNN